MGGRRLLAAECLLSNTCFRSNTSFGSPSVQPPGFWSSKSPITQILATQFLVAQFLVAQFRAKRGRGSCTRKRARCERP